MAMSPQGAGGRRPFFRRRKSCPFSGANAPKIDYKDVKLLQRFVSERGKIVPSRITAVSAKKQRELAEARNNGENAAYQAERQLKDLGDAVDSSSKDEIEQAIKAVRESLTSDDAAEINAKTETLHSAFHKVSEAMYQRAQEQAAASSPDGDADGAASSNGAGSEEEDVVDAEVVDEK